jgi:hypothetical protein
MKRSMLFLFGSLILLLNCPGAKGQGCGATLVPHFSVYNSVARNGKNVYTTVSMQGYADVSPGPGCQMSTATHHVGAENKVNNVDHWSYSGNGCPTCYYSVTDNEQFVGVPGVSYPWTWDGVAICSIVGGFFGSGGGGSIVGCVSPSTETTTDKGFNGFSFREQFDMTLSDSFGDNFNSSPQVPNIHEATAAPGTNGCYWSTSGLSPNPGVQGSYWSVGTVAGVSEPNHWGYDSIGWNLSDLDNIVQNGPAHGIQFPCVTTLHQAMYIMCNANTWWNYRNDDITIAVDNDPNAETVCRDGICGLDVSFSDRWTAPRYEWARILNSVDSGLARPSPQSAKEARQ